MRHVALVAVLSFAPAGIGAIAGESPDRTFPYGELEIRGYAMQMSQDGTFKIYSGSMTFVEGTFDVDGNQMTISDTGGRYACVGKRVNPGRYFWTVHDQALRFALIEDKCHARRSAFLEAPLSIR
ncbi:MAG: hypothetical protein GWO16_06750 [Gammaproteobacteria bacterium]|nr:hypothetical protein [Gammaproteobacteria bacterium]NIT63394.1 hypothetical protein [Gammaproteobacteria bacterium]NIX10201.1 hypothetical protein [Gammaproteobacteria bacterium]NIY31974.1 hypothetical protein [Gammaproteobacteria bacterium]